MTLPAKRLKHSSAETWSADPPCCLRRSPALQGGGAFLHPARGCCVCFRIPPGVVALVFGSLPDNWFSTGTREGSTAAANSQQVVLFGAGTVRPGSDCWHLRFRDAASAHVSEARSRWPIQPATVQRPSYCLCCLDEIVRKIFLAKNQDCVAGSFESTITAFVTHGLRLRKVMLAVVLDGNLLASIAEICRGRIQVERPQAQLQFGIGEACIAHGQAQQSFRRRV